MYIERERKRERKREGEKARGKEATRKIKT
jgi:hypothetical protein